MPPPPKPAPVQKLPSPPNFYGMLKHAVKQDSSQVILAVLQHPLFVQAVIGLCNTAKAFPGTPVDRTRFLGTTGWRFTDQANFPVLVDQKDLFVALSAILPLLDCGATNNSLEVRAFFMFANTIIAIEDHRREACWQEEERCCYTDNDDMLGASSPQNSKQKANADPEPKPRAKRPNITPAFTPHKPGSNAVLALLAQVDTALEAVQLVENGDQVPRAKLQKHHDAVDQAMQRQLYLLDIALQTFHAISDRHAHPDKALGLTKVDHTGSLLDALNSSNEVPDDSDVKFQDPPAAEAKDPVVISKASQV
ncbi:hypothetical protein C0993_008003, partial [Termitomyces sp. T159_Od127]